MLGLGGLLEGAHWLKDLLQVLPMLCCCGCGERCGLDFGLFRVCLNFATIVGMFGRACRRGICGRPWEYGGAVGCRRPKEKGTPARHP